MCSWGGGELIWVLEKYIVNVRSESRVVVHWLSCIHLSLVSSFQVLFLYFVATVILVLCFYLLSAGIICLQLCL